MPRRVLLPREIDERLANLTGLVEEVDGILLYRKQRDICPIEVIFMMGVGSVGQVQAQPERIAVANAFFRKNQEYQFVKFHTHSRGTIERFGNYYARHFSQEDLRVITERLREDEDYMAMLVTPETKLLSGIDNPRLEVVNELPEYQNRSQAVNQALSVIAVSLGYDLSMLQATRK